MNSIPTLLILIWYAFGFLRGYYFLGNLWLGS